MATVEIDSYELYHIGNKLNPAINFEKLREELRANLETLGFTITKDETMNSVRSVPSEVIAIKKNVKLELNYAAQALNLMGTEPYEVTLLFEEVLTLLQKMEYEIDSLVIFFEVIASVILKSQDKPVEKIGASIGLNPKLFADNNVPIVNTIGLRIGGNKPSDKTFINLTVEPSPINPNLKTTVRVHYRAEKENIIKFHEKLSDNIKEIFKAL
ncbi:MAG: hypothetical protein ACC612_03450 [Methanomethylovorans sp.]|jgi:hypothetical protein|uniref:hypothetical protein n=1 Tax=Methanomethylovorans sp. TaxID=2758717 RepID=UPI0035313E6E